MPLPVFPRDVSAFSTGAALARAMLDVFGVWDAPSVQPLPMTPL